MGIRPRTTKFELVEAIPPPSPDSLDHLATWALWEAPVPEDTDENAVSPPASTTSWAVKALAFAAVSVLTGLVTAALVAVVVGGTDDPPSPRYVITPTPRPAPGNVTITVRSVPATTVVPTAVRVAP